MAKTHLPASVNDVVDDRVQAEHHERGDKDVVDGLNVVDLQHVSKRHTHVSQRLIGLLQNPIG